MLKLQIIGNLGRDPEMRYTPSGQAVTSFSVAATRTWKNAAGEKQKETTWVRMTAWGKLAEVCSQYLAKGKKIFAEGRLVVDSQGNPKTFQRNDGTTGAAFEMTVENIEFLSSADHNGEGETEAAAEEVIPL